LTSRTRARVRVSDDLTEATSSALEAFRQAKLALREAWRNYHVLGRQVLRELKVFFTLVGK